MGAFDIRHGLFISLLLHGLLVASGFGGRAAILPDSRPAMLHAELQRPERPAEAVLKDTFHRTDGPRSVPPPEARPGAGPDAGSRRESPRVFYPSEARARGWEGEVTVLLILDPAGRILNAEVAASSGHEVLDRAALAAVTALGTVSAGGKTQMLWPVVFRLPR